jgi:hypothetical protein
MYKNSGYFKAPRLPLSYESLAGNGLCPSLPLGHYPLKLKLFQAKKIKV